MRKGASMSNLSARERLDAALAKIDDPEARARAPA